jgi:hypothetical protein
MWATFVVADDQAREMMVSSDTLGLIDITRYDIDV